MPQLTPLRQWYCDTCGQIIDGPEQGYLSFFTDHDDGPTSFTIVHHKSASPLALAHGADREGCYPTGSMADLPFESVTGTDGLFRLLSYVDIGPVHDEEYRGPRAGDLRSLMESVRRLHLPYYEEARTYFHRLDDYSAGASPAAIYREHFLREFIEWAEEHRDE